MVSVTETSTAKEFKDWLSSNKVEEAVIWTKFAYGDYQTVPSDFAFFGSGRNLRTQHMIAFGLNHCNWYIYDLYPSLIKNMNPVSLKHLLNPVLGLEPSVQTEQTLYLASILIKTIWNTAPALRLSYPEFFCIFIKC